MKRILLPTDFSENAWNTFFAAVKIYTDFECMFYLLHTHEPNMQNITGFKSSVRAGNVYQSLAERSEKELVKMMTYIEQNHRNSKHHFQTLSMANDLVEAIKECIPNYDIDTIIMGTKGATGAKELFFGSNTVKVLKKVKNRTLIIIPESFDFKSFKSVVLPTEYVHFFSTQVLRPVLELIAYWKSEVKIVYAAQEFKLSELQESNKEILKKRLEPYSCSFFDTPIKTNVSKAIRDFAKVQDADLIVLTNYSHTFLERLTQEPIVKKIGFKSDIPLMVLPDFEG